MALVTGGRESVDLPGVCVGVSSGRRLFCRKGEWMGIVCHESVYV